jgi:Tfp pilus assembly protein PilF
MSDTHSVNPLDRTADGAPPADGLPTAAMTPDAAHPALLECLGVGGMGEVYRVGDSALERDLAIKVLKAELAGDADAERRFLREARVTGSLQHPGVVPVHGLGRLADGRPCYTMKLVRGRTLADLLRDGPNTPERLAGLLVVFEKVCQAVAYAHSKGVIHRDLKPSNVMVGEFGEVQVMDWGLAKVLSHDEPAPAAEEPTEQIETVARAAEAAGLSRAGAALGTPNYMPPEQAAGDWDIVDERADVFALGAILCEVLTGRPPYHGGDRNEVLRRARRGDLADALTRLEACGADTALVELCRECLAAEPRPRNAGVVAERLASYQAEVRERLRRAELERARAEVQALERRKRRRLAAALALAALLLLAGWGAVWWQSQRRQAEADGAALLALGEARLLQKQVQADPLTAAASERAVAAARHAAEVARAGGASEGVRRQADDLAAEVQREADEAAKDRRLLAALLDVRGPREGPKYKRDDKGLMAAQAEPTADEQFAAAFRDWGLDVDATPRGEAAARLKACPPAVLTEVIAALDEWASERQRQRRPEAEWSRVADLAALLDEEPGSKRRELRAILAQGRLPLERALGALSAMLRPVPLPVEVPLGPDRLRLRQLAEQTNAASEPILGLLTLVRALLVAGEEVRAEQLLRAAIVARPREVVLHHTLGQLLAGQKPPRWAEAVECYQAARALRPDLGVNLARLVAETPGNPYLHFTYAYALSEKGRLDEAIDEYRQAIAIDPKRAVAHDNLGYALYRKGRLDEAIDEYRRAIALDPKDALTHNNLGNALYHKGRLDEAMAEYRQAIALDPRDARGHNNLGAALLAKGRLDEAMEELRQAIALDPKYAGAHYNLGHVLARKERLDEAMAEFRQAIVLDPRLAGAHYNLGVALERKGRPDEAMDEWRQAIALDPKDAKAHGNLGLALAGKGRLDEAMAEYHKALAIDPKNANAHGAMGQALLEQGRYAAARDATRRALEVLPRDDPRRRNALQQLQQCERLLVLDRKLSAVLTGEAAPANPGETVALASMCRQPYQKRYAASARLYADAFAAEPRLAADLNQQHRYNAACSAALAAAGQGADARLLPDRVAVMFRGWALAWLRDDLKAYAGLARQANPSVRQTVRQRLLHWRADPDLASVRRPQVLDRLPENERAAWRALWRDVDELSQRLDDKQK